MAILALLFLAFAFFFSAFGVGSSSTGFGPGTPQIAPIIPTTP
jgi:hypothetical protein